MADAPGHKLGQIIGDLLEEAYKPALQAFCDEHGLYLDFKQERTARRNTKCSWQDSLGNSHDLDFVIERGGTDEVRGLPAAFIELAWRRYTKHSKAKAQEMQGAVLPLLTTYSHLKPFAGAIVAGKWTSTALEQMRSSGFVVLHISYANLVGAFKKFDIDIEATDDTSDQYLLEQVQRAERLTTKQLAALSTEIRGIEPKQLENFLAELHRVMMRSVAEVIVLTLYGEPMSFGSVIEAVAMLNQFVPSGSNEIQRIEIHLRYSNGDEIRASFGQSIGATEFLETFTN